MRGLVILSNQTFKEYYFYYKNQAKQLTPRSTFDLLLFVVLQLESLTKQPTKNNRTLNIYILFGFCLFL